MADALLTEPPAGRWAGLPLALRIGILYLGARIVTTGFLLLATTQAVQGTRFGPNATIGSFMAGWDAQWYWFVAANGYPSQLPLTDGGLVQENQWAFLPVYPYLSAFLGVGGWVIGGVVVSLVAGFFSALVLYRMLRLKLDATAATWAVVFFACGPLAAMFQVGYAESLFLLWLLLALWMVLRRTYGWLYLLVPLMGFTRPGVLAFALLLGLFLLWRWLRRRQEPLRAPEIGHVLTLGVLAIIVGFAWQVIAGMVTGDPSAYLSTELAWRRNWLIDPGTVFVPFEGFLTGANFWFSAWGFGPVAGYIALAVIVVTVGAVLLFEPHVRRLGVELRLWSASYLLYLLAVFFPQSSIFRLLLPLTPLWGALAAPKSTAWRVGVLMVALIGQWWWIYNMYALGNAYWQVP